MKIGRKIALFYTLITVLTTMIVIGVFYLFSSRYIDGLYQSYLREKAFLTAQKHWERMRWTNKAIWPFNGSMMNCCRRPKRFC